MEPTIVETLGVVHPDGTLELDRKVNVRPGRVKVRLESVATPATTAEPLVDFVDRMRRDMAAAGHQFRTKEAIDVELGEVRGEWDR